jgi:pimeloyl-ACP methyl ester carboxylesterase
MSHACISSLAKGLRLGILLTVFAFIGLLAGQEANAQALVFVHGKSDGVSTNSSEKVFNDYWTPDMIRAATRNFTVPYIVVHYDGRNHYWDGAVEAAAQINQFIDRGARNLVFVTHSMGGLVTRFMLCNADPSDPHFNFRGANFARIQANTSHVLSYAPPNAGSEAADLAQTLNKSLLTAWLVTLIDNNAPSTQSLTTSNMRLANSQWMRDSLRSKPIFTVAGTGLFNDFCIECLGLATLSGLAGFPGEDDGLVAEYSAHITGAPGGDWYNTDANHHYNRRNSYRPLGQDIAQFGY